MSHFSALSTFFRVAETLSFTEAAPGGPIPISRRKGYRQA